MKPCTSSQFRAMHERLTHLCPPPGKCSVKYRRSAAIDGCGEASKSLSSFVITIRMGLTYRETLDTLIHEYAHVMDWRPHHALSGDHGATWGVWYARIYSSYHQER